MSHVHPRKPMMLSYQWNIQKLVEDIHHYLENEFQCEVWMDTKGGMKDSLTAGMAEGVQNCSLLICFLTPEYQQSVNCKKELTYAMQLKKSILPILIGSDDDPRWKPTDWLGLAISDLLYLNLTDLNEKNFSSKCEELAKKIDQIFPFHSQTEEIAGDGQGSDLSDEEE